MPEYRSRKYVMEIEWLAGFPGVDISRDLVKIAVVAQDADTLTVEDTKIPTALQQDEGGALYTVLKTDNAGLLKDTKIPKALQQDAEGSPYVLTKDDAMARFKAGDYAIQSGEIYFIGSGGYWAVSNLTNDGRLVDDGTLYVFGSLGGDGVVEGEGTIVLR